MKPFKKAKLKESCDGRQHRVTHFKVLPPKVFLSQCEKIYSDKLSNAEDGINFDMFCKLFFQERKKLDAAEARRLGESFLDAAYNDNIIFLKHIYNQGCNVEYKTGVEGMHC